MSLYGFASDQSPKDISAYHWTSFMGHVVPVHTGAEMLAKRFNMNVIFLKVKKIKRGYYETTFSLITDNAKTFPNYKLTDIFLSAPIDILFPAVNLLISTSARPSP